MYANGLSDDAKQALLSQIAVMFLDHFDGSCIQPLCY